MKFSVRVPRMGWTVMEAESEAALRRDLESKFGPDVIVKPVSLPSLSDTEIAAQEEPEPEEPDEEDEE